jgi:hypothetical protein
VNDSDEELTAYHEAGHACVAFMLGARVQQLTIEPDRDDGPERFGDTQVLWVVARYSAKELCRCKLQTALGGPVAEMIYLGEPYHPAFVPQWSADWLYAVSQMTQTLPAADRSPARVMQELEQQTRELHRALRQDHVWAAIAALADELVAHETLERDAIRDSLAFWLTR